LRHHAVKNFKPSYTSLLQRKMWILLQNDAATPCSAALCPLRTIVLVSISIIHLALIEYHMVQLWSYLTFFSPLLKLISCGQRPLFRCRASSLASDNTLHLKSSLATRDYFETLLLAILIADSGTVLFNVPLGSGNCFSNSSEAVFGTSLNYFRNNIF